MDGIIRTRNKSMWEFQVQNAQRLRAAGKALVAAYQSMNGDTIAKAQRDYQQMHAPLHHLMKQSQDQLMHVLTVVALALAGWMMGLSWPYWLGVTIVAGLLIYEHSLVSPTDLSKLGFAFFNVNGYIAVTIFVATLVAMWV